MQSFKWLFISALLAMTLVPTVSGAQGLFAEEVKAAGCNESLVVDDLLEGYFKSSLRVNLKDGQCATLYALRLTEIVRNSIIFDDRLSYASVMNQLDKKMTRKRELDRAARQCAGDQICPHEKIYFELALSFQQLWNTFYIDQLTAQRWSSELKIAGAFAVGGGLGAYMFGHSFPYLAKSMGRGFSTVFKGFLKRLGLVGRSAMSGPRIAVAAGAGTSLIPNAEIEEATRTASKRAMFPAPIEFMDLGEEAQHAAGTEGILDMLGEVTQYTLEVTGYTIIPGLIADALFLRFAAYATRAKWLLVGLTVGRKPTVLSIGILAGMWLANKQAEDEMNQRLREIDARMAQLSKGIELGRYQRGSFAVYLQVSEYVELASEKSMILGLKFTTSIHDLHREVLALGHCYPYLPSTVPTDLAARNTEMDYTMRGRADAVARLRTENAEAILGSEKTLHDAIAFLSRDARPEWRELIGSLRMSEKDLLVYSTARDLPDLWRIEATTQAVLASKARTDLDQIWAEYSETQTLTPQTRKLYMQTLSYVGENSSFENSNGQPGYNCPGVGDLPAVLWRQQLVQ